MVTDVAEENSAGETNSDPIIIENDWVSSEMKPVTDYYIGNVYIYAIEDQAYTCVWYIYYVHTHNIISFVVLGRSFIS